MEQDENEWLGTKEALRFLGITQPTLYRLIDSGSLVGYKIGRVIRFRRSDLEAYLESARIQPGDLAHLYPDPRRGPEGES